MSEVPRGPIPESSETDIETALDAEMFGAAPNAYVHDPVSWARAKLGRHLWSKQREAAESVVANRFTAVPSCHNAGKSFLAATLAAWWIDVHPPGTAIVVTTAPNYSQIQGILWRELGRAHDIGSLPGRITLDCQWKIPVGGREEIVGIGRAVADHDEHGLQGYHADHVLVIVDEGCGIVGKVWTQVDALMTGGDHRAFAIGNPDDPTSDFETVCAPGSKWHTIHIDGLQMPTLTSAAVEQHPRLAQLLADADLTANDEALPDDVRSKLLSVEWIIENADSWGTDDPRWQSKVRGVFPAVDDLSVFPRGWVERAVATDLSVHAKDAGGVAGLDVADVGKDETVMMVNKSGYARCVLAHTGRDTTHTESAAAKLLGDNPAIACWVDGVGVGAGVFNRLRLLGHDVHRFLAGSPARGAKEHEFANIKAAAHWALREAMRDGVIDIDAHDAQLLAQLRTIRWTWDARGRIAVEDKDTRRRKGRRGDAASPDRVDALVMAWQHVESRRVAAMRAKRSALEAAQRVQGGGVVGDAGVRPSVGGSLTSGLAGRKL